MPFFVSLLLFQYFKGHLRGEAANPHLIAFSLSPYSLQQQCCGFYVVASLEVQCDILAIKQEQLALCKLLLTNSVRRVQNVNAKVLAACHQSKASSFNKKSVSEMVRIPSLSCQGTTGAFCIKIRLNPSPILRKDCVSCWRFSPVGISKAD